eukprot:CAMPEP_0116554316 /NCGR_PEP_ID=MMETSP0397-20121206/7526_1 /TAXON_ID=216820 /ORGANISM="Cyclophora tenuis, Strain ECT3854" /LENGTH=358 /DNA_ID=CAMNT_0004079467 /DNA_START=262 /DNA_END=1334 /DNA_ORIENTATION=-
MDLFNKDDSTSDPVPEILRPLKPSHRDRAGRMVEEWELAAHKETKRIMLRESTQQIAKALEATDSVRVLVEGNRGVGKTAALAAIVASARKSGHIVLYLPDGDRLRKLGHYIEPNEAVKGLYDLPLLSQEVCADLLASHENDLDGMMASKETLEKYTSSDHHENIPEEYKDELSLVKLLRLGAEDNMFSALCYSVVMETLMNQSEKRFIVVMDEFNCYYDYGHYFHADFDPDVKKSIPYENISLFKPLLDAMGLSINGENSSKATFQRGGILAATTESRAVARKFTDALLESASIESKVEDSKQPLTVVHVPRYSAVEVEHMLSNMECIGIGRLRFDRGSTVLDDQEVAYLRMVSGAV